MFGAGGKEKPNAVIGVGVVMADRPMYFDCANEHGLAIAGLNFPGYASFVHEPVEGTENVATFEFPLWVARNFDSVDEVEEALRNVTLVSQIVPGRRESLLHWFIGDGKRSIVVEQMADGMHVHHEVDCRCADQSADIRLPYGKPAQLHVRQQRDGRTDFMGQGAP